MERLVSAAPASTAAPTQLRADAGMKDDGGTDEEEGDDDEEGFFTAMLATMYTPQGFRVVCECPWQLERLQTLTHEISSTDSPGNV